MIQLQRERYLARQAVLQRTDVLSSPPESNRSNTAPQTTDTENYAYQGEDVFESEDDPSYATAKVEPGAALRKIYSNRKKPSLASAASSIVTANRMPNKRSLKSLKSLSESGGSFQSESSLITNQNPQNHQIPQYTASGVRIVNAKCLPVTTGQRKLSAVRQSSRDSQEFELNKIKEGTEEK